MKTVDRLNNRNDKHYI